MAKNFKRLKICMVIGILLISTLVAFTSASYAKGFLGVEPLINVTPERPGGNVIPKSGVLYINLTTTFDLTGFAATWVKSDSLLKDSSITITLQVQEDYGWIDASITNQPAQIKIGDSKPYHSILSLTVTEKAPAFTQGKVTIVATSSMLRGLFFNINEKTETFEVPFEVGYWPVVKIVPPEGTLKQIGPTDTADFPVDVANYGNGMTKLLIEVTEMPAGDWSVSVPSSVTLQSSDVSEEGIKDTVHIKVKPPYNFGFHNTRKSFKVTFTPIYIGQTAGRPDLIGQPETVTFTVQSVGFSTGTGFELPTIVIVLAILFVGLYLYKSKRKK